MFKKVAFAGLGLLLVISPLIASADTASELRAKIDKLLAQVKQLKEQVVKLQPGSSSSGSPGSRACSEEAKICPDGTAVGRTGPNCAFAACPGAGQPSKRCIPLLRALQKGSRGSEVTALQNFLIERGNLETEATGFFGEATEAAVQDMQLEDDIVSSGAGSAAGWGVVGPRTRALIALQCGNPKPKSKLHASPKSGQAPLRVTFRTDITHPSGRTLVINFGDGEREQIRPDYSPEGCSRGEEGSCKDPDLTVSHTYDANGTYTARLVERDSGGCSSAAEAQGCLGSPAEIKVLGTVVIRVGKRANSGAPSISSVSGPTTLATGKSGTWKVNASASDGNLRYSVIWGDEDTFDQILGYATDASQPVQSSATFTHTYASPGNYKPRFTVSNSKGSAKSSISVVVGGGVSKSLTLSASPKSGPTPLSVEFSTRLTPAQASSGSTFVVNFGDDKSGKMIPTDSQMCLGAGCQDLGRFALHTYTSAGTYTAKLIENFPGGCTTPVAGGPTACADPRNPVTRDTVVITVSGPPSPTLSASPKSGQAPLAVSFTVRDDGTSGGYQLNFGDGATTSVAADSGICAESFPMQCTYTKSHTYSSAGTYTATLSRHVGGPSGPEQLLGTQTITVSGTTGGPSISGVSGPTSLSVAQSGTWTVNATAPAGNLSYSVIWGDEVVAENASLSGAIQSTATFTHSYAQAGTYKPKFTVLNGNGSAQTSTSVTVQ